MTENTDLENDLNAICRCAYLVASGDADFAQEEFTELESIRGMCRSMILARPGIEHLEQGGTIEEANALFDIQQYPSVHLMDEFLYVGDVPDYLSEVHQARGSVTSSDELTEFEAQVASLIKDPFIQHLAIWVAIEVAAADGEITDGELHTLTTMCEIWGISPAENSSWMEEFCLPLVSSEDEEPEEEEEEENEVVDDEEFSELWTALILSGDEEKARESIQRGCDVNESVNAFGIAGVTPLMITVQHYSAEFNTLLHYCPVKVA